MPSKLAGQIGEDQARSPGPIPVVVGIQASAGRSGPAQGVAGEASTISWVAVTSREGWLIEPWRIPGRNSGTTFSSGARQFGGAGGRGEGRRCGWVRRSRWLMPRTTTFRAFSPANQATHRTGKITVAGAQLLK